MLRGSSAEARACRDLRRHARPARPRRRRSLCPRKRPGRSNPPL